jgi:hypothetical protein
MHNHDNLVWCKFAKVGDTDNTFRCTRCRGRDITPTVPREPHQIHRPCSAPLGWGDRLARAIETVLPWTKKKKCGGCKQRQEALNALGRKITGRG